jgi:hypothetical protein
VEGPIAVDFIVTVTLDHSGDSAEADAILEGFLKARPGTSPVVGEDLVKQTIDITFEVPARSAEDAFDTARVVLAEGMAATDVEPRPIVGVHIERSGRETAADREPQLV